MSSMYSEFTRVIIEQRLSDRRAEAAALRAAREGEQGDAVAIPRDEVGVTVGRRRRHARLFRHRVGESH